MTLLLLAMAPVLFVWAGWTVRLVMSRAEVRAELDAERVVGAALVDTLRRQVADALASETAAEALIQELLAELCAVLPYAESRVEDMEEEALACDEPAMRLRFEAEALDESKALAAAARAKFDHAHEVKRRAEARP